MDYYFDTALSHFDKTSPQGKKEISKIILPAIKRLPNKIEQSHWIQKLSQKIDIREDAIIEELKKINAPAAANSGNNKKWETENNLSEAGRKKLIEEKVVSLILKDPENINVVEDSCLYLFSEKTCQFLKSIKEVVKNTVIQPPEEAVLASENTAGKVEAVFADLPQEKKNITDAVPGNFMAALSLKAEIEYDEDGGEEVQLCILQLKNIELKNKLHSLSDQIKEAERAGDMQKVNTLVAEFTKLSKEL
jgi:DNA primase